MSKQKRPNKQKDRIDAMLDKPVPNLRYGGLTMREALMRGVQRPKKKNKNPKSKDDGLQFEL
ncbi:MAG: hypothetical protein OXI23_16090 [Gemmatimonadota bacterium]|nr:hypothetical protein [Gemmatimonadota bacterium]